MLTAGVSRCLRDDADTSRRRVVARSLTGQKLLGWWQSEQSLPRGGDFTQSQKQMGNWSARGRPSCCDEQPVKWLISRPEHANQSSRCFSELQGTRHCWCGGDADLSRITSQQQLTFWSSKQTYAWYLSYFCVTGNVHKILPYTWPP